MNRTAVAVFIALSAGAAIANPPLSRERRAQLIEVLISPLQSHGEWTSVHAAEDLIRLGKFQQVRDAFAPQADGAPPPFRIGVWRVLARSAPDDATRDKFIARIRAVMMDPGATDWIHAMEALAKVNAPIRDKAERDRVEQVAFGASDVAPFAAWRLAEANDPRAMKRLTDLLQSNSDVTRARTADALRRRDLSAPGVRGALTTALEQEPADSPARPLLIAAIGGSALRSMLNDPSPTARSFAVMQLAEKGDPQDTDAIQKLLNDPDRDVRIAAAFAILRIDQRNSDNSEQPRHEDR